MSNYKHYLANLLSQELKDKEHLGFYLKLVNLYKEDDIFFIYSLTKDICRRSKKPIKNKGALFTKLFFDYVRKKET